jgi:hypothetical protein
MQFLWLNADHGGLGHRGLAVLFGPTRQNSSRLAFMRGGLLPIWNRRALTRLRGAAGVLLKCREAVMEITAVDRSGLAMSAPAPVAPDAQAAENREIVRAVKAVNGTEMFGQDNQLVFRRDPETHRMVIRLVDPKTEEVLAQIPEEYILRLAEDLKAKTEPKE